MPNKPKRQLYKVEMLFIYGWDDAGWTISARSGRDRPMRFSSITAAQAEIDGLIADVKAAVKHGDMDLQYRRSDYRVVPVTPRQKRNNHQRKQCREHNQHP